MIRRLFLAVWCCLTWASLTGCSNLHPKSEHGEACAAIGAARKLAFYSDRLEVLEQIAGRPDLTTHEQLCLINAICESGFSSDKADALVVLAENPCLCPEAGVHLADSLTCVGFSSDRKRVAAALAQRPPVEHAPSDG